MDAQLNKRLPWPKYLWGRHFRWSFRREWELLTQRLATAVRACHKYGIYMTEHHSSHLTHNPLTPEEDERLSR